MNMHYTIDLKKKLCERICIHGDSTIKTAQEYNIPLKTLEKWIMAFNKNNHCFDSKLEFVIDFKINSSNDIFSEIDHYIHYFNFE